MFFPLLLSRYKRIEIIIQVKANFHKEIAQFTILVAITGNKISKYFSLLPFRKYSVFLHDKQTGAVNLTRAIQIIYDLFSLSDASSSQIIIKETVVITIETS